MSIAKKLTTIAENQEKVFDAGKQAEHDRFWDAFQKNGNLVDYEFAFAGPGWTDATFDPKHNIIPTAEYGGCGIFYRNQVTDVQAVLEKNGVVLDTSKTTILQCFQDSKSIRWGTVDMRSCIHANDAWYAFCGAAAETIDKLVVNPNVYFDGSEFIHCANLKNLTIEGEIGTNGFNVQWSPLTHDSLMSIINALQSKTSGTTWKVTLGATNIAKLTAEEIELAESKGWTLA